MTDTKRKQPRKYKSEAGKYKSLGPRPAAGTGDRPPPDWVLEEREVALAAELPPGEQHLGSPAPSRSALSRRERKSRFSARFLLRTPWGADGA
jgi:hypothetical protein